MSAASEATAAVKTAFSPGKLIAGAIGFIAIAALFDLAGITQWLLYPVSTARAKFMPSPKA